MKREIKFRAWKEGFAWCMHVLSLPLEHYGENIDRDVLLLDHPCPKTALIKRRFHKEKYSNLVFMQYTGFKDKRGKEIFEGDIVKDLEGSLFEIKYGVESSGDQGSVIGFFIGNKLPEDLEIVGNVFEDKELMKYG